MRFAAAMLAALILVGGCQRESALERLSREAEVRNPPKLWAVSVVRDGQETAKVTLCASDEIRAGFTRMIPMHDGKACALNAQPKFLENRVKIRCIADGRPMLVETFAKGDLEREFSVYMRMRSLDAGEVVREQTRRYRFLGACPAGWTAGWSTDRSGRVVPGVMR